MDHPSGSIEQIIQQALGELGFANPAVRGQTFLLRDRRLVGRRFCFESVTAVWLTAERWIKFFDDQGECLRVLNLAEEQTRMAA